VGEGGGYERGEKTRGGKRKKKCGGKKQEKKGAGEACPDGFSLPGEKHFRPNENTQGPEKRGDGGTLKNGERRGVSRWGHRPNRRLAPNCRPKKEKKINEGGLDTGEVIKKDRRERSGGRNKRRKRFLDWK